MPLGNELKNQTSIAEKHYQGLNKLFKSEEKEEPVTTKKEKSAIIGKWKLMYGRKYSFSYFSNIRKYYFLSFTAKYNQLVWFYNWLNQFWNLVTRTEKKTKIKKKNVYRNTGDLYNTLLPIYFNDYSNILDEEKRDG